MQLLQAVTGGQSQQPNAQASAPAAANTAPYPTSDGSLPAPQDFGDYYNKSGNAGFWNGIAGKTGPGSIIGTIAGAIGGQDAARLNSPASYLKLLSDRATTQGQQLDLGQTVALMNRMGYNIDPNNIMKSFAAQGTPSAQTGAAPQPSAPAPQGQAPAPPQLAPTQASPNIAPPPQGPSGYGAPSGAMPAPSGPPAMQGAPQGANPADAMRANYTQMAQAMGGLPKFMPQALEMIKAAQTGAPAGTIALPSGQLADAATGQPINTTTQGYNARGAGMIASAQEGPRVAGEEAIAGNQASLDRQTAAFKSKFGFTHTIVNAQGQSVPVSDYDLATGGGPAAPSTGNTFALADTPFRAPQMKQTADAQTTAAGATQMQQDVDQLGAAIKQFGMNGPLAPTALGIMQHLSQLDMLDPATKEKVAAGELAQLTSNNVAAGMARQLTQGGRMLAGVFNQVVKAKPSIMTSNPSAALEALHQEMQRQIDKGQFVADYYGNNANATKLDADTAFDRAAPVAKYESFVLPVAPPANRANLKVGYGYKMPDGKTAIFDGTQFQRYNGLGQ